MAERAAAMISRTGIVGYHNYIFLHTFADKIGKIECYKGEGTEMLTAAQLDFFHTNGYLHVGRVIDDSLADTLREHMFAVMAGQSDLEPEVQAEGSSVSGSEANIGETGKPEAISQWRNRDRIVVQIVNIWQADDLFRQHLYHPIITQMAAELMATDTVRVWHDQVQYKPPRIGGPTDWHQDHPYWPIIQPADLVSAWMALDDATVENGCMWMVPGSHKWGPHKGGTIGTDPEDFSPTPDLSLLPPDIKIEPVPCPVKKGELMFHHCLTWHGSPPNRSEHGRPGIAVHYMPGYTRYEPQGRTHLVHHNIEVEPGEILQGRYFPTVFEQGKPVKAGN